MSRGRMLSSSPRERSHGDLSMEVTCETGTFGFEQVRVLQQGKAGEKDGVLCQKPTPPWVVSRCFPTGSLRFFSLQVPVHS